MTASLPTAASPADAAPAERGAPSPKVALVTGAARRLGREIALTLARQGWDVAVHCRGSLDEARQTAADIQALAEHVVGRAARGAVVNLLDQKLWNPNPDFLSYTLSKAALESATTLLALALAPAVRVVGVAPGLTLTSEWLQGEKFEQLHQLSPLGRSSSPDDVAATVAFALANRSMTGTTVLVDGGQHLQRFARDFSMM